MGSLSAAAPRNASRPRCSGGRGGDAQRAEAEHAEQEAPADGRSPVIVPLGRTMFSEVHPTIRAPGGPGPEPADHRQRSVRFRRGPPWARGLRRGSATSLPASAARPSPVHRAGRLLQRERLVAEPDPGVGRGCAERSTRPWTSPMTAARPMIAGQHPVERGAGSRGDEDVEVLDRVDRDDQQRDPGERGRDEPPALGAGRRRGGRRRRSRQGEAAAISRMTPSAPTLPHPGEQRAARAPSGRRPVAVVGDREGPTTISGDHGLQQGAGGRGAAGLARCGRRWRAAVPRGPWRRRSARRRCGS